MPNTHRNSRGSSQHTSEHLSDKQTGKLPETSSSDAGSAAAQSFDATKYYYDTSHDASAGSSSAFDASAQSQEMQYPSLYKRVEERILELSAADWSRDEAEQYIWDYELTKIQRAEYTQQRLSYTLEEYDPAGAAANLQRRMKKVIDKYGKRAGDEKLSKRGKAIRNYVGEEVHNQATVFARLYQAELDGSENKHVLRNLDRDIIRELWNSHEQCKEASKNIETQ